MKTRKVGKLVSLILAIVLVATIMIPAVNVLAESSEYDSANWIHVSDYASLKSALDNANQDEKTYIRLDGEINLPNGAYYKEERGGYFIGEVIVLKAFYEMKTGSMNEIVNTLTMSDLEEALAERDIFPLYLGTNPYVATQTSTDKLYIPVSASNIYKLEDFFDFKDGKWNASHNPESEARDFPSYEDINLIVHENTDVTIDLNNFSIKGANTKAYSGTPGFSQTGFVVYGDLTVLDLTTGQKDKGNGQITGGTGYIAPDTYTQGVTSLDFYTHYNYTKSWDKSGGSYTGFHYGHDRGNARTDSKWHIDAEGRYSYWMKDATESRGGGVYVCDGGTFTLESGKITGNCAWMESDTSEQTNSAFKSGVDSITKGGGVYVEAGGTFNMNGGEISNNAARSYQKKSSNGCDAYAYGGGVYLESAHDGKVATMNMTAGKIAENATYAEILGKGVTGDSPDPKNATAQGGGIYVGEGAVCSIMGSAKASGEVTEEMMASFPQVTNNSIGAETRSSAADDAVIKVEGAGIYCAGTLNIEKVSITANDFSEAYNNLASSSTAVKAVHVMRDDGETEYTLSDGTVATKPGANTGLALYILEYNNPGPDQTPKTYITRLDPRFQDNLELATELVTHESSGFYGTGRVNSSNKMITDGAGVYMATTGTINIGERTWIYDNYDLVTTGHKSFENSRHYKKYWVQEYTYNDPVVETDLTVTDRATAGKEITDAAGRYVYYGEYNKDCNNGYCWSDTRDDVYLPDGVVMYKGSSLFECRIGVNYYNMVNDDGTVSKGAYGQAGNRVIVKSSSSLDPDIWGGSKSTPSARDIQFFYLNDNNKNYEYENYTLPNPVKPSDVWPCNPSTTTAYDNRDRVAAIDVDSFDTTKKTQSPYEGYINYDKSYDANTWIYSTTALGTPVSQWDKYNKQTYRISDPSRDPKQDSTIQTFDNAIVNLPQRAYQLTDDMIENLPESYRRAKYMDYKVVYDNDQFGTESEPVLRFGQNVDRQMYFTVDFDEANIHYYGKSDLTENIQSGTDLGAVSINTLNSSEQTFVPGVDAGVYYYKGASNPQGTVTINPIVPDYNVYKDNTVLNDRIENRSVDENGGELTSITKDANGIEDEDLFFKGWSLYVSYGYKDEDGNVVNASVKTVPQRTENDDGTLAVEGSSTINNLTALNYHNSKAAYVFDLSRIYNPNVNAQPCLSMTATWYTKEELEEARTKVSNVMCQTVQRQEADGTIVDMLRFVAIAGSDYPDFDEAGFVISTTNATPTIEGGYDYSVKTKVYEKLGVNKTVGAEKMYYDTDKLLGGTFDYTGTSYEGKIVDASWTFTEGSQFKANLKMGTKAGQPYYQAGIFYTNIIITDENADQVYFVTPYAKQGNTYYYGESRAVCYNDRV